MQKPAITQVPIQETITNRWSGRAYDAAKPVSQSQIIALLEAARWAPSCYGDQPWRIVLADRASNPNAWQQAFDCLVPGNQGWAKDAPVLLLGCANTLFDHNGKENRFAQYDTGAAIENLCLQATHMGLMAHQMGGFDAAAAREKFNIPLQFSLMAMVTVGYPAEAASLPEEVLAREIAPRQRKPLGTLFFDGVWDQPII